MDRGERRDRTRWKAKSRKRKLISAVGVPSNEFRKFYKDGETFLDTEPGGKFRNNSISNEYAHYGKEIKTNRKKGHSNYRSKGSYGPAMNWKPHDKRQLDSGDDDRKESENDDSGI